MKLWRKKLALMLCTVMLLSLVGLVPDAGFSGEARAQEGENLSSGVRTISGDDVSGGDVSGGDVSGGDVSGGDGSGGDKEIRTVSLNPGGGGSAGPEATVDPGYIVLTEDGVLPALPTPVRPGWIFQGWYTGEVHENLYGDEDGETITKLLDLFPGMSQVDRAKKMNTWIIEKADGQIVKEGDVLPEDVSVLYALYEPTTVNVRLHWNGWKNDTGLLESKTVAYGSYLAEPSFFTDSNQANAWTGHSFLGWYTGADASGSHYTFSKSINGTRWHEERLTKDLDLYVHWEGGVEAESVRISPVQSYAEPGSQVTLSFSYLPASANKPSLTWEVSDPNLAQVVSFDGSLVTIQISKNADVVDQNKHVTVWAKLPDGTLSSPGEITICHTWDNLEVLQWPTCEEGGMGRYYCTKCSATKDVYYSKNGHRYVRREVAATCTEEGYTERVCRVCGESEKSILQRTGHQWVTSTVTGCGGTVTTTTCSVCGLTTVENDPNLSAHQWEMWPSVDKRPTCTTAGSQSLHCKKCGVTKDSYPIPADPTLHQWSAWTESPEDPETEVRFCSVCHARQTREKIEAQSGNPIYAPDIQVVSGAAAASDTTAVVTDAVTKLLDYSETTDSGLTERLLEEVKNGESITAQVKVTMDSTPEDMGRFEALVGEDAAISFLEIDILVMSGSKSLGNLTDTGKELSFTFDLPASAVGKTVTVLREHNGIVESLPCEVNGNKVTFRTSKFSTFALCVSEKAASSSAQTGSSQSTASHSASGNRSVWGRRIQVDWDAASAALEAAKKNSTVNVPVGTEFTISAAIQRQVASSRSTLACMVSGTELCVTLSYWDVKKPKEDMVISLSDRADIPEDAAKEVTSTALTSKVFNIGEKKWFSQMLNLHVALGEQYAGKLAVMYSYDEITGRMRYESSFRINEDGQAMFPLSRGDEYVIVVTDRLADYKIQKGDCMSRIAARNGISLKTLLRANPQIKNPNKISVGDSLIIPGR